LLKIIFPSVCWRMWICNLMHRKYYTCIKGKHKLTPWDVDIPFSVSRVSVIGRFHCIFSSMS
jgi:hypothetical protein